MLPGSLQNPKKTCVQVPELKETRLRRVTVEVEKDREGTGEPEAAAKENQQIISSLIMCDELHLLGSSEPANLCTAIDFLSGPSGMVFTEDKGFPFGLQLKKAGKALTAGAEAPPAQSLLQKEDRVQNPCLSGTFVCPAMQQERLILP